MQHHGGERPVVVGEYNGPTLFEFPQLDGVLQQTMAAAFTASSPPELSTSELAATATAETPERRAVRALYDAMADLPAPLRMFMAGCGEELDARRDRINGREIVTRNLLALATGVRRSVCWQLAAEVGNYQDPFTMNDLLHGKLTLLRHDGDRLGGERPPAAVFRRLAHHLDGAAAVERVDGAPHGVVVMAVERCGRRPLTVLWRDGDAFAGEDQPPVRVAVGGVAEGGPVVDAFGAVPVHDVDAGQLQVEVSVTPVFAG
jgi:hypothetical protein